MDRNRPQTPTPPPPSRPSALPPPAGLKDPPPSRPSPPQTRAALPPVHSRLRRSPPWESSTPPHPSSPRTGRPGARATPPARACPGETSATRRSSWPYSLANTSAFNDDVHTCFAVSASPSPHPRNRRTRLQQSPHRLQRHNTRRIRLRLLRHRMRLDKQPIHPRRHRRLGQHRRVLGVPTRRVPQSSRLLRRVRCIEDHRHPKLLHHR